MNEDMQTLSVEDKPKQESFFKEIFKFSLLALLIVIPIRLFIAQPFIVSGASMDPTFETNQYLIVDQLSYRFSEPKRGEIIIFRYPKDTSKFFIKRIIGLPGETIEIRGFDVIVTNDIYPTGYSLDEPYIAEINLKRDHIKVTLKENEYFVLGDNRRASSDSRIWGPLEEEFIVGRAIVRLFPIKETEIFPGTSVGSY